jgi:hypothetical protein
MISRGVQGASFGPYFHRSAVIHPECPLYLVEAVAAPTGHFTTGERAEREPSRIGARGKDVGMKGQSKGRAAPAVPVQARPVDPGRGDRIPKGLGSYEQ